MQGTWQFMSTRLLTSPGSRHTITDDLESHYFVLMWTALHWVRHNRPNDPFVGMEHIFDHQWPLANGIVEGGAGKVAMYGSKNSHLRDVEFACEPFNKLFWDLWTLFAIYLVKMRGAILNLGPGEHSLQDLNFQKALSSDADPEPSVSPREVIDLFEAALKQPGWIDDKVADQFPRAGGKKPSGNPLSDLGSGEGRCNPDKGKKRALGKSLGIDLEQLPAKRPKGS